MIKKKSTKNPKVPKTITVILKPSRVNEYYNLLPNLARWLKRRKIKIQFLSREEARVAKFFKKHNNLEYELVNEEDTFKCSDLVITLGGDGTLIGIAKFATNHNTPIFGVNLGHLGFTTEFQKKHFYEDLDLYLGKKLNTEKLNLYTATIHFKSGKKETHTFLNDAVFSKSLINRMFTLFVESNEGNVFTLTGDGMIASTPVGSTAYSLAAGGPIVHPLVKAMILTPICPHGLTNRPLVLPESEKVKVSGKSEEDIMLTLDGQRSFTLKERDYVVIKKSRKFISLVKNPDKNYYDALREKFYHGRREGVK